MFNKREYDKKWRETHKEQIKAYRERNKDKRKEYDEKYRIVHKDEIKVRHREYMKKYRLAKFGMKKRVPKNPEIAKVKMSSYAYVKYHFNDLYNGKVHQIHHCFGLDKFSFVIMYKTDHKALHKKFGHLNENCLLTNENVKIFIQNCPHILVVDGEITENTMKSC